MSEIKKALFEIKDPEDYYKGLGQENLPVPANILLFLRRDKQTLQGLLKNMSHHRYILIFNLETTGHIHVDHLSLEFFPGQALMISPFQFHHFSHLTSTRLQWLFCTFELPSATELGLLKNRVLPLNEKAVHIRNALIKTWISCNNSKPGNSFETEELQAILFHLLVLLKQETQKLMKYPQAESSDKLLDSINRFMAANLSQPINVEHLAETLHISPSCLRARFKKLTGFPLGRHIRNYRIHCAMALLRNSDRSIAEVAEETGFGSPQAFCRIFKKETSLTPRAYRNLK